MLRVTVLERGRLVRSTSNDPDEAVRGTPSRRVLPRRLYDRFKKFELDQVSVGGEGRIVDWRNEYGIVGQWVGVIQIPGLQLEILPKIDGEDQPEQDESSEADVGNVRDNLVFMLARGGLVSVRARGVADLALRRGSLYDQLVSTFLDRTQTELGRGYDREYTAEEGNLLSLRGKLLVSQQVTKNAAQRHRFFCRHDALTEATIICVRLKQACRVLLNRALSPMLTTKVQTVLALLDGVPDVAYRPGEPSPTFTRQNDRFREIYNFACMVLESQAADAKRGDVSTFSLLFNMDQVFERFIAEFVKSDVGPLVPDAKVVAQGKGDRLHLFHDSGPKRVRVLNLKPDLLVEHPKGTLVIDTKWKRLSQQKSVRPDDGDLYQLYAYLHRYECKNVYLLYPGGVEFGPRTLEALRLREGKGAGNVGVRFVDMKRSLREPNERSELAKQLAEMLREGLELPEPVAVEAVT
jgi:5-methylcytosine-specific restriction enzyme subunit McrC